MRKRYKRGEAQPKIQDLGCSHRVHAAFLWYSAKHAALDVGNVLGHIAEVEVAGERGYDACVVELVVIIVGGGVVRW